ncbi:signal transduction histidine kinase, LytS [Cellulophaga algicola DSM 14237]|uniref:Signal transduction histidine kinase, LytS n=1 Tax=Cellulophaga algicola (strain DSM 14237 / IC166 / ACAM 630) TaxID=688270 RepID=E6XCP5_CELAD|nr:tetratricopeptide repeat protein [Cellulophaga algicola]ADV49034.1 signal transduction histidine kinase, LytS [Cellulophaga algicola DSM 14237]
MQGTKKNSSNPLRYFYWPIAKLACFLFTCLPFSLHSQDIPKEFIKTSDSLIFKAPSAYTEIDKALRTNRRDTLLMRYFASSAAKKKYLDGEAYALNQLGTKYRNISKFSVAIELHKKALEAADKANNLELKVYSLNMLSVAYRRIDAVKTALDYAQEAIELAESVPVLTEGLKRSKNVSLNGIGNIYQNLKQYKVAIEIFEKSLVLEEELHNKLGQAINNQNIGECYEELGDLRTALNYYRKSLAFNEEMNNDMGRVICNNSIAQVFIKQKKTLKAKEILKTTLSKSIALGDHFISSSVFINLGWAQMELGELEASEENLIEGIRLSVKYDLPRSQAIGYNHLSNLFIKKNDYEKSLLFYKRSKEIEDDITNETNVRYVNDVLFRYDTEKKNSQIEALARENELVRLKLRKNENTLLISTLLLALSSLILYILYRQFQLKNEKKLLTLEQSMLRSQMNPHFLFNSLNSIKLYIINNEKKNAVYYLNKFSKLVRKILEASSLKEISLAEELETIELYMNIENIRFSNEIDFQINIENGIDPNAIKIPSLILQPFLENAIWHGLSTREDGKSIHIDIKQENDYFTTIAITDNGIGRAAAEVIKENKVLKRKSIGIDITKERLANFSKDFQNTYEVQIIDLYDENKKPCGTTVIVSIPTI